MKPTHLLIPIGDINLLDADMFLAQIEDYTHGEDGMIITKLRGMLQKAKEISLSEEDIEKKAKEAFPKNSEQAGANYFGYKQALKDLLNDK